MRADFPSANSLLKTDLAMPVQFRGSRLARELLRWMGWKIDFQGLPAMQGVAILYPHTSNWDFPVAMLLKSAMGIEVKFWAKDSLFTIPYSAAGCAGWAVYRSCARLLRAWSRKWWP
jgi:1-acyl-sn-glycerol-3-phosphate acyltransferase